MGVQESCNGDGKAFLLDLCQKLPNDTCLDGRSAMIGRSNKSCGEDGFQCGDGQCVHGLSLCDNKVDCLNGADEIAW